MEAQVAREVGMQTDGRSGYSTRGSSSRQALVPRKEGRPTTAWPSALL